MEYVVVPAIFVLALITLRKRFSLWSIFVSVALFCLAVFLVYYARGATEIWVAIFSVIGGIFALYDGRKKPIEQLRPTVTWMVIHGLWEQLAQEGLPPEEIERLKRLTPDERAWLMAAIKVTPKRSKPRWEDDDDDFWHYGYYYALPYEDDYRL